jgi:hypothetical protein
LLPFINTLHFHYLSITTGISAFFGALVIYSQWVFFKRWLGPRALGSRS